jgi:hypothetical protein
MKIQVLLHAPHAQEPGFPSIYLQFLKTESESVVTP